MNRQISQRTNSNSSYSALSSPADGLTTARIRQTKKDEAIRKRAETDLNKRKNIPIPPSNNKFRKPGTVSSLKPGQALTVQANLSITEASQFMAAKRTDCVLVVDENEQLIGIFTSKDIAYRVVAEGLEPRNTAVIEIMTPNPMCVTCDASATDALTTMVEKGFRHLPVVNEDNDVFGLLDITKCLYDALEKMDRAYDTSKKLYDAIQGVNQEWGNLTANNMEKVLFDLKETMACPTLETIIDYSMEVAEIKPKNTVRDAAKAMKNKKTTAVMIIDNNNIAGIFTSKDIVLRVIAADLNPSNCSVVRVMTPHPECATPETTILDAIKRMNQGKFLNLPVVGKDEQIIDVVDVLKLTYATLNQISSIEGKSDSSNNQIWDNFWGAALGGSGSSRGHSRNENRGYSSLSDRLSNHDNSLDNEIYPNESVSAVQSPSFYENNVFIYKLKSSVGKVYRFSASATDFNDLLKTLMTKLPNESFLKNQKSNIGYIDDEGDSILLSNSNDLIDAINLANQNGWKRLILKFIDDDDKKIKKSLYVNTEINENDVSNKESNQYVKRNLQNKSPNLDNKSNKTPDATPLVPDHLIIPTAVFGGFLTAALGAMVLWKFSK